MQEQTRPLDTHCPFLVFKTEHRFGLSLSKVHAGLAFGSLRGKTVASLADSAQQYLGFAHNCLKVARSLPEREDRIVHREMAAEWIRLAQMMAEDAAYDTNEAGKARIGAVS